MKTAPYFDATLIRLRDEWMSAVWAQDSCATRLTSTAYFERARVLAAAPH
jgi:hypothetical protein